MLRERETERERDGYKWVRGEIGERDSRTLLKKEKVTTRLFLMVDRVHALNAITVASSPSDPTRRKRRTIRLSDKYMN